MKMHTRLFLIFSLLFCCNMFAQTDLTGTWQGKLTVDQNTKMTIHFVLTKKADGSYSAVLNSPDTGGIKNVTANVVQYSGGKLKIEVASLSGSYSGTVAKGTIAGEWKQQGTTFPLVLTPYQKPSAASLKPLLGEWVSKLKPTEDMTITVVFHFENTKDGKFIATFDQPEQGGMGLEISDVVLEGNQVSFKIPIANGDYKGTLSGNYKVSGRELAMNLVRGKYQAPETHIDLSADSMKLLAGRWVGKLGPISLVFRFERNAAGKPVAFIDSPDQKAMGLPVSKASMTDGNLLLELSSLGLKYSGKVSSDKLDGTLTQGGRDIPLPMIKEQASAPPKK
jgi:hypothetical protein